MKDTIYLDGLWGVKLDAGKEGIEKEYYKTLFDDSIMIPSTLSQAQKG